MKLAIDIDDVVLATTEKIVSILKDKYDLLVNVDDINVFNMEESVGVDPKLIPVVVNEAINSEYIEPIFGAVSTINWLGNYYEPIYFITNRYSYQSTLDQIQQLELDTEYEIKLCGKTSDGTPNKAELINDLGITTVIEDRMETILDICVRTSANILVFDRPWNKDIEENDRIYRVRNWIPDIIHWFMNHRLRRSR